VDLDKEIRKSLNSSFLYKCSTRQTSDYASLNENEAVASGVVWKGAISISWSSLYIRWIGSCSVNGYVMIEARGRLNCRSTGVWKGAILKVSLTLLDGIVSRAALETLENVAADLIKF
jgi:hypothetical protein